MKEIVFKSQAKLALVKVIKLAWKNIYVRFGRSLFVTLGIMLPITFLMYVLISDHFLRNVEKVCSYEVYLKLKAEGILGHLGDRDRLIQQRWMVGLALLVSFVGIVNSMLMSIAERFREIGTMKCLGAMDGFIVKLFFIESIFHGITGGIFGVIAGLMAAFLEGFKFYGGETIKLMMHFDILLYSVLCVLVGIFLTVLGAIYPAIQAARMKPVDALRTEV